MDNDDAIVGRILSRREALALAGKGGLGLAFGGGMVRTADAALQAKAQREVQLVASPALTEGPFFVDEKLNRSNLLGDTTRVAVVRGAPLALTVTIYKLAKGRYSPLEGGMVDVWHADAAGVYSDESHPMNHENTAGQNWLRGYQITGKDGIVRFETILPGWYPGRTTHIHFKVRQTISGVTKEFTSQLFFDDALADQVFAHEPYRVRPERAARNSNDGIFGERQVGGGVAGDQLTLAISPEKSAKGYTGVFAVALTDESLRTGRGRGDRPGGPPRGRRPGGACSKPEARPPGRRARPCGRARAEASGPPRRRRSRRTGEGASPGRA